MVWCIAIYSYSIFQSGVAEWRKVFLLAAGVYCFGALMFLLLGSGEEQPWSKEIPSKNANPYEGSHTDDSKQQNEHWKSKQWVTKLIKLHIDKQ